MEDILLFQGAEARIYESIVFGKRCIIKQRFVKTYRLPDIDVKINAKRISNESRTALRMRQCGIDVPVIYLVDPVSLKIYMEYVDGQSIKDFIHDASTYQDDIVLQTMDAMGAVLAKMHQNEIIHGDLTTSNMMIRSNTQSIVMIDFGLSSVSGLIEDMAVDLYVLERAFLSTHPDSEELFQRVLDSYQKSWKNGPKVISRLDTVRSRGRKKIAFG
eukprot:TRINITY_DN6851_c0_g1_i2.p1 TRINITY_DN6851_c0_g1~~TRINITY_DN6851_c0_g1_i2.p1  ORF type:complete len:216 (-),score=44.74 TRINITY_DN6851_c0_g1_i2:22-669(-)